MLTFFRRIRKGLLGDGATSKYMLYAIGEIALVVIGILIALQINNWNEDRIKSKNEITTLRALHSEFSNNQMIIDSCISLELYTKLTNDSLLFHSGPNAPKLSKEDFERWIWQIGTTPYCKITSDILEDIRNSGKLSIVSNEEIRLMIGNWSSTADGAKKEENVFNSEFSSQFMPYTNRYISWSHVDFMNEDSGTWALSNAQFEYDYNSLLKQMEFANIILQHGWRRGRLIGHYRDISEQTRNILRLIENEIDSHQ